MRLSVWQFLGLLVALVALYFVYHYWWVDQDRDDWTNKLHRGAIDSTSEVGADKEVDYGPADSWAR